MQFRHRPQNARQAPVVTMRGDLCGTGRSGALPELHSLPVRSPTTLRTDITTHTKLGVGDRTLGFCGPVKGGGTD